MTQPTSSADYKLMASAVRALAIDGVEAAKSGHPGLPLGAADIATVLFTSFLRYDASNPSWPDRDRFILSAGHGSMLVYALLHLLDFPGMSMEEIRRFRQKGSKTPGHPEFGHTAGIEMTTGPLGQGLASAVGMAIAETSLAARFGSDLVDHRTVVLCSDGDLMEGISQEAIALAGHLRLNKLIVLWDDNNISIDGPLSLSDSTDQLARFAASNWATDRVDGHDPNAILAALERARASERPTLIACRTIIGYGAPKKAGTSKAHGEPLGADELTATKAALGWTAESFTVPDDVRAAWREAGKRAAATHVAWQARLAATDEATRNEFIRSIAGTLPAGLSVALDAVKASALANPQSVATRKASEIVLEAINAVLPETIGGSADLSPSNLTRTKTLTPYSATGRAGRYIHFGIREHAMAAAMNGMALHGGIIPYAGTFLVFADYCRPSLRLAALMGVRVVHVMTHDSIGVGEDGPTHQPVEHLAALRAIPNLLVFRPCDTVEAAEAWLSALSHQHAPSIIALSRQAVPQSRSKSSADNQVSRGAYEISPSSKPAAVTLFASGTEVSLALAAQKMIEAEGYGARVVSVPCFELFEAQDATYRRTVIGEAGVRIAIEAAIRQGWDRFIGEAGIFVGMSGFGMSAPYAEIYDHFAITPTAVTAKALDALRRND
ncbi:transketolase [Candidatus Raskinella chloraquaticus]